MKSNSKGTGVIAILLSILVVTAVGFTGYYVWTSQQEKKDTSDVTNSNNDAAVATTNSVSASLTIKELGIIIPVENWGFIKNQDDINSFSVYSDKSKQLASKIPGCDDYSIGKVFQSDTNYSIENPDYPGYINNVDGTFFVLTLRNEASCTNDDGTLSAESTALNEQQMKDAEEIKSVWNDVKSVNQMVN
jgi:uncharacterized protein (UPF0333 family)